MGRGGVAAATQAWLPRALFPTKIAAAWRLPRRIDGLEERAARKDEALQLPARGQSVLERHKGGAAHDRGAVAVWPQRIDVVPDAPQAQQEEGSEAATVAWSGGEGAAAQPAEHSQPRRWGGTGRAESADGEVAEEAAAAAEEEVRDGLRQPEHGIVRNHNNITSRHCLALRILKGISSQFRAALHAYENCMLTPPCCPRPTPGPERGMQSTGPPDDVRPGWDRCGLVEPQWLRRSAELSGRPAARVGWRGDGESGSETGGGHRSAGLGQRGRGSRAASGAGGAGAGALGQCRRRRVCR